MVVITATRWSHDVVRRNFQFRQDMPLLTSGRPDGIVGSPRILSHHEFPRRSGSGGGAPPIVTTARRTAPTVGNSQAGQIRPHDNRFRSDDGPVVRSERLSCVGFAGLGIPTGGCCATADGHDRRRAAPDPDLRGRFVWTGSRESTMHRGTEVREACPDGIGIRRHNMWTTESAVITTRHELAMATKSQPFGAVQRLLIPCGSRPGTLPACGHVHDSYGRSGGSQSHENRPLTTSSPTYQFPDQRHARANPPHSAFSFHFPPPRHFIPLFISGPSPVKSKRANYVSLFDPK